MVRKELSPEMVDLQWEARMGLSLRCSCHGRQRVLGTSRSMGAGEAEIKLGADTSRADELCAQICLQGC